jgi:glycerol uptake facilitator-like aquaporin
MFKNCKTVSNHISSAAWCFLILAYSHVASAQESLPSVKPPQNPNSGGNLTQFFSTRTPFEFWLSCLIMLLGLAIIGALILAVRRVDNARPEDFARPIIVVTVIIGTLLLVTVGYNNEQIAPAFGLFGTIVGYLLGRLAQSQPSTDARADQQRGAS